MSSRTSSRTNATTGRSVPSATAKSGVKSGVKSGPKAAASTKPAGRASTAAPKAAAAPAVTKRPRSSAARPVAVPPANPTPRKAAPASLVGTPVDVEAPVQQGARSSAPVRVVARASAPDAAAVRAARQPSKILPLAERPIDQVWREYRATPTEAVRNYLIGRHLDLVAYAAERLHKRLPSEVEINDLKSAGAFGLMDAVESFDPDRGVKFETYCTQRIRGAMFDELRSMDWVPRLVRSRTAKVEKVRKSIEMETGARATDEEVAKRLNVSGEEFEKLQKDSRPVSMVSLTRKCFETDSSKDVREIDVVEDGRQENPLQVVQKLDLRSLITKGLSRAERLIVILYYYEEMTMKEIGATLDLSESRVSQMHSSILARLKAQLQHRESAEE